MEMDKSIIKLSDVKSTIEENADTEYSEKNDFIENKRVSLIKTSKKKMNMKDLIRFKGVKSKHNSVTHITRKRANRNKSRHMMSIHNIDSSIIRSSDDECAMEKKIVLYSTKNKFMIYQDICAVCGSVGIGNENCLISCAQCAQCYHLFCVNIKLSKAMLHKGWRCLDCTVCEGCGQKNDEARLILCDECDISYHIYCMNPPLDAVPNGNWKCKSCSVCRKCGEKSFNYKWMNGNWECDECVIKSVCFICSKLNHKNEIPICCKNCKRWLHKTCQATVNGEETQILDNSEMEFNCVFCHLNIKHKFNLEDNKKHNGKIVCDMMDFSLQFVNDFNSPTHIIDGVYVSHQGLSLIKTLTMEIKKKRKFRPLCEDTDFPRTPTELTYHNKIDENVCTTILENKEDYKEGMVWVSSDNSPPLGFTIFTNNEGVNVLKRKRQRNLQKVGIGGFNVKNRTVKTEDISATCCNSLFYGNKRKKPLRRKFKNKINESYPVYLREAFFGKTLLDSNPLYLELPIAEHNSFYELQSDEVTKEFNATKDKFKTYSQNSYNDVNELPSPISVSQITLNHVKNFEEMSLDVERQTEGPDLKKNETCCANKTPIKNQISISKCSDQDILNPSLTKHMSNEPIKHILMEDGCLIQKEAEKLTEVSTCGSQKTAEKMRIDEDLGTMATISAVLYSNTQHTELKKMYPLWNDRCKQILKIWRSLSTDKKAPFLQQAKENRSTLRLRRTTQYNEGPTFVPQVLKGQEKQGYSSMECNAPPLLYTLKNQKDAEGTQLFGQFTLSKEQKFGDETNQLKSSTIRSYSENPDDTHQLRTLLLKQGLPLIDSGFKMQNSLNSGSNSILQNKSVTTIQKNCTQSIKKDVLIDQSIYKNKFIKMRQDNYLEHEKTDSDENGAFGDILGGLDEGDDDDLIKSLTAEIGDDFNILEYADPELDVLAENQILLNKLDFDDSDKKM